MKAVVGRIFRRSDSEENKAEIEEELRFHLELLTQEHLQPDVSLAEAKECRFKTLWQYRANQRSVPGNQ